MGRRQFFRKVSHVESMASHRDGDGMGTGRRHKWDGNGLKTLKPLY